MSTLLGLNTRRIKVTDILPPKPAQEMKRTTVELPVWQWARLKEISKDTQTQPGGGYTRDEVVSHFLTWAIQEWDAQRAKARKK